jgi:hypothetical protein
LRYFVYSVLAVCGLGLGWLFCARFLIGLLDRVYTVRVEAPALDHFRCNNGSLELGPSHLELMTPKFVWCCVVSISAEGRVALASGGVNV